MPRRLHPAARLAPLRVLKWDEFAPVIDALRFLTLGGLVGLLAWNCGSNSFMSLWILMLPFAWVHTSTRLSAVLLMAGYYLASAGGMISGVASFFGEETSIAAALSLWLAFGLLNTVLFAVLWSPRTSARPWRFAVALVLASVPPFAIVGSLNPLIVSGLLFPALGWFGLLLTFATFLALGLRKLKLLNVCIVMSLVSNALAMTVELESPANWKGLNTHFDGMTNGGSADAGQILGAMQRIEWLKDFAASVPANSVRILPETVLGPIDSLALTSLSQIESDLRARHSLVIAGAELPLPDGRYENSALVLGSRPGDDRKAVQNIPVPIAMWKPWTSSGAKGGVFGHANRIQIKGVDVAVMVCYEQLLPYSLLSAMLGQPKVLLAMSNVHWARGTSVPSIQRRTVESFARLFAVPLIQAENS